MGRQLMTEELPRFAYLHCARCNAWLAMYGLPSRAEPKIIAAAPERGWVRQEGGWWCDAHAGEES
jgi:hypothetical protein